MLELYIQRPNKLGNSMPMRLVKCGLILLSLLAAATQMRAQIVLNEFNSKRGFEDNYGEQVDWVEVFNASTDTVYLGGYYLSDNPNNLDKWRFPDVALPPQEPLLVCASGREDEKVPSHWESLVKDEDLWKYWSGTNAPPANYSQWNKLAYNDANWPEASGGFGYGDNDDQTEVAPSPSLLLRRSFEVADVEALTHLVFHADYDDGFIAYLNGVEIMRSTNFANASPAYNEFTTIDHEAVLYQGGVPESRWFEPEELLGLLQTGTNVLALASETDILEFSRDA